MAVTELELFVHIQGAKSSVVTSADFLSAVKQIN